MEAPRPLKERLIRVFTRHKTESLIFLFVGVYAEKTLGVSDLLGWIF